MPADRSVRTLLAAMLLLLALFIGINYALDARPIVDWWLPLVLLAGGVALAIWSPARPVVEEIPTAARGVVVYNVSDTPRAGATVREAVGPEEEGEVNVREPQDEVESQEIGTRLPDTGPEGLVEPHDSMDAPPRPIKPPPPPDIVGESHEERALDDLDTAGTFAPPTSGEAALNPPTTSDEGGGYVIERSAEPRRRDPARPEMPFEKITEPEKPRRSEEERLKQDNTLLQPSETAENEFQDGEHVASTMPTETPPPVTQTTGEGRGAGTEPMEPAEKEVLDTQAAPYQPQSQPQVDTSEPDVVKAVTSDEESDRLDEAIAPSERISPKRRGKDDLTQISGVGKKMAAALRAAGIDSFTKLAGASEDEIRAAIEDAGLRFAPTLSTWRQQAIFLARDDREGFEALLNAMRGETAESEVDQDDQKQDNFLDTGRE